MGMIHENPNDSVYNEVQDLKRMVRQVMDKLAEIQSEQQDIKLFEGKQTLEQARIANAVKIKRFTSIVEWKNAIWERCPNKKEDVGTDMVTFHCTLLKGPCRFEACPRNFIDDDPYHLKN